LPVAAVAILIGVGNVDSATFRWSRPYRPAVTTEGGNFGSAIAVAGNRFAIGAPLEQGTGAVYVFDGVSGEQRLRRAGDEGDALGTALTFLGDEIAAGAPGHRDRTAVDAGRVIVLDARRGDPRLVLGNPARAPRRFGASVVAVGGDLVVGAPGAGTGGAAYRFDGATGAFRGTFQSPTPTANDQFGFSLAALGPDVAIGAPGDPTAGHDAGAVFVFHATTGALVRALRPPEPKPDQSFGFAVAGDATSILVGAPGADAVYVFDRANGDLLRTLRPRDSALRFGSSLALVGPRIAVGAPRPAYRNGAFGAAYLFDSGSAYAAQTVVDPDGPAGGGFGVTLGAASGETLLVAATGPKREGLVWPFAERAAPCPACEDFAPSAGCGRVPGCEAEVWCLGDSITAIYAPHFARLAPGWRVHDLGNAGERTIDGWKRLRAHLDEAETFPAVTIVLYGTNDLGLARRLKMTPAEAAAAVAERVGDIVSLLHEHGIRAIVGLPLDSPHGPGVPPEAKDAWSAAASRLLRARLFQMRPVVDFRLRHARWYTDPFHPNEEGALVLVERARRAVRRVLRTGPRMPRP
jgi:lysophospholipase L1-like esterase